MFLAMETASSTPFVSRPKDLKTQEYCTLRQDFIKYLYNLPERVKIEYADNLIYKPDGPKGANYEKERAFNALVHQIRKGVYAGELEAPLMAEILKVNLMIYNSETSNLTKYGSYTKMLSWGT